MKSEQIIITLVGEEKTTFSDQEEYLLYRIQRNNEAIDTIYKWNREMQKKIEYIRSKK